LARAPELAVADLSAPGKPRLERGQERRLLVFPERTGPWAMASACVSVMRIMVEIVARAIKFQAPGSLEQFEQAGDREVAHRLTRSEMRFRRYFLDGPRS
jgi:hypothetical protein